MEFIKSKWREILTILIGLCIVFGRVVIPTTHEITVGVVLIDVAIGAFALLSAILLNKEKVKEIINEIKQDSFINIFKKAILVPICIIPTLVVVQIITQIIGLAPATTSSIADAFADKLLIGAFISIVCIAPVVEELVFRLSFRSLISNNFLFVILSSIAFAFIHEWFYFTGGFFAYFAAGVVLSLLYLKWGKLHYNIFGHFLNNFISTGIPLLLTLFK